MNRNRARHTPSGRTLNGLRLFLSPVLLASLLLSACSGDDGPSPESPLGRLTLNRRLWSETRPARYDFRLERSCFCQPEYQLPLGIRVLDDAVVEVWHDPGHAYVDPFYGETIDGLFERIERAIVDGYETVEVRYDSRWGYPAEITLDKVAIADEQFGAIVELLCRADVLDATPACDCPGGPGVVSYDLTLSTRDGAVVSRGCLDLTRAPSTRPGYRETLGGARCLRMACGSPESDAFQGEFSVAGLVDTLGNLTLDVTRGQFIENVSLVASVPTGGPWPGDILGEWYFRDRGAVVKTGPFSAVMRRSEAPLP